MELLWGLNDVTCVKYWVWTEACEGLTECQLWAVGPFTAPWGRYCVTSVLEMRKLKLRDERCKETCQGPTTASEPGYEPGLSDSAHLLPYSSPCNCPFPELSCVCYFRIHSPLPYMPSWVTKPKEGNFNQSGKAPYFCFVYEKPWSSQVRLSSLIKILGKVLWRL